ncbi:MAG: DinB family protein [Ginsengibacter sp.]
MRTIQKAKKVDYPDYAEMYIKLLLDDGNVLQNLYENMLIVKSFIYSLSEEKLHHRYQKDKWSIKQILVHIIDDERIFSYRALCFARNENLSLNGFDQDAYAEESDADTRSLSSIFEEYEAVRMATIALFSNLPENALDRIGHGTGTFNDASARALVYHIAGHELHHINFIKQHYLKQ